MADDSMLSRVQRRIGNRTLDANAGFQNRETNVQSNMGSQYSLSMQDYTHGLHANGHFNFNDSEQKWKVPTDTKPR